MQDCSPSSVHVSSQGTNFGLENTDSVHCLIDACELDGHVGHGFAMDEPQQTSVRSLDVPDVDEIHSSIQQFFDKGWIVFPVLSYDSLWHRMSLQPAWHGDPPLRTLLLSIRMINLACEHRIASENTTALSAIVRAVERSRLDYDFAEPPTLDEVVVSLFLFVAHNVLEKHTRAYLYLDEAFSLLGVVDTCIGNETQRKKLIEQVLFNTEAASIAIYAHPGRQRRAQIPTEMLSTIPTSTSLHGRPTEYERLALHLLTRLTVIHAASDDAPLDDGSSSSQDLRALWTLPLQQRQYCRIQAADVSVSQQWQISTKLAASLKTRALSPRLAMAKVESLGVAAMAWICSLREGELRIVGLGKIFGMLQAIRTIAGSGGCASVTNGLVGALMREDHDRRFAAGVASILMPLIPAPFPALGGMCIESQTDDGPAAQDCYGQDKLPAFDCSQMFALAGNEQDRVDHETDWVSGLLYDD